MPPLAASMDKSYACLSPFVGHLTKIRRRMTNHPIGIPACFSSSERPDDDSAAIIRGGQNIVMSAYQTKIAGRFRLITVTWYKNMLVHGLSVSVQGAHGGEYYCRKIQLKPWLFWRKEGLEQFNVDGETIGVVWDLKAAKFNGETGPQSNYYVAIICDQEVVLLLGDLKKDAFRRTGCRPALDDPMLVSRKEHVFGKRKFSTRAKFHEKEEFHEISIECFGGFDPDMEIRIDGDLVVRVKHLQWKFRGNELIQVDDKVRMELNSSHLPHYSATMPQQQRTYKYSEQRALQQEEEEEEKPKYFQ
ncbi:hypothetical protein RHGRI_034289 [Rhododendron griersonianum]|uniref:Uncharacterized protein n=1 Tax=Rhododendron griersonianum TaxID=479676 RepID=A0AAV6HZY4_9ERIC|nr:hypothetical protein RHGRI_034289 [Rhododendron griersonianum]